MRTVLTADIGATKVNVASFAEESGRMRITRFKHYLTKESPGLVSILQEYLSGASGESQRPSPLA